MSEYDSLISGIVRETKMISGVDVVHAPSTSAGEKIIYRYSPGKYDGEYETLSVTMRFLSKDSAEAFGRMERVSRVLCSGGTRNPLTVDGCPVYVTRYGNGGSGYIGKTGHFFVLASFEVKRPMPSDIRIARGEAL